MVERERDREREIRLKREREDEDEIGIDLSVRAGRLHTNQVYFGCGVKYRSSIFQVRVKYGRVYFGLRVSGQPNGFEAPF